MEMQHAKKLVVVDFKFLEQLQTDREYKQIQKPADALAKSSLSLDIGRRHSFHSTRIFFSVYRPDVVGGD